MDDVLKVILAFLGLLGGGSGGVFGVWMYRKKRAAEAKKEEAEAALIHAQAEAAQSESRVKERDANDRYINTYLDRVDNEVTGLRKEVAKLHEDRLVDRQTIGELRAENAGLKAENTALKGGKS